jgi:beta-1,4-mannosyltransferase
MRVLRDPGLAHRRVRGQRAWRRERVLANRPAPVGSLATLVRSRRGGEAAGIDASHDAAPVDLEFAPTRLEHRSRLPAQRRRGASPVANLRASPRRRRSPRPTFWSFGVIAVTTTALLFAVSAPERTPLNYVLSPIWSMYFPLMVVGLIGAAHLRRPKRRRTDGRRPRYVPRSFFSGRTDKLLIVTIPSLVKRDNLPALQRVITSVLAELPKQFDHFRVDVIAEDDGDLQPLIDWLDSIGALGTRVRVLSIPSSYRTPNGARFKTRANHYGMQVRRLLGENDKHTYIYHLDDDTHIGEDTAASLAEFIELRGNEYLLAQGVLAFPHELTPSRFCRLADSIRPADDLTRFAFFTGSLGTPLGGLHGEHLVVRADIENEIGWDFADTVIEDAYFAIEFCRRYPGRACTLNSYSYGASPCSVADLVRQRRRWIEGLLRLLVNRRLPFRTKLPLAYAISCWALAPFQFVGIVLLVSYLAGVNNTSPVSNWIVPFWSLSLAYVFWQYLEGLKVNLAASSSPHRYWPYAAIMIPFVYLATPIETAGVVLGFVRFLGIGRQQASEVITKPL